MALRLENIKETKVMNDKEQDPNLQAPQVANTTKHINFLEAEEADNDTNDNADIDNDDNPTKKAWEALRNEQKDKQGSKD
ncbi:MAG: hypothetical protein M3040_13265 [Bacteroidota bacterium]|nr:hypothetical protein [Bacteroidota bacterium]